jgi:hypothetical protein
MCISGKNTTLRVALINMSSFYLPPKIQRNEEVHENPGTSQFYNTVSGSDTGKMVIIKHTKYTINH